MSNETETTTAVAPVLYSTNTCGYKVSFPGPSSVEEYDKLSGKVGACLEDACENEIYRGTLPEFQSRFAAEIAKVTGIARGVDTKATDLAKSRSKNPQNVQDIPEKFKAYNLRVRNSVDEVMRARLDALAQEVANGVSVDPSPTARKSGLSKDLLAKAETLLALDSDVLEVKIAKISETVPNFILERDEADKPTKDSLARLLGAYLEAVLV